MSDDKGLQAVQPPCNQSELIKALGGIPTHELIDELQRRIADMPDHSRMQVWHELRDGYCSECGIADRNCQCWNDE